MILFSTQIKELGENIDTTHSVRAIFVVDVSASRNNS